MYNTLLRMWKKGQITAEKIDKAVGCGWITEEQAEYIKSLPQG